jgi:uncharacterized protein (DUF1330 family)
MAKGYLIANIDVHDSGNYAAYVELSGAAAARYGGRFLVRGGRSEQLEGSQRSRHAILEFESYEAASAYYRSSEYQNAIAHRVPFSSADIVVVEGLG